MILKLNHVQGKIAASTAQATIDALYALLEEGAISANRFAKLQVELDWVQYKQNFRELVHGTQRADANGKPGSLMSVHVNTRNLAPEQLKPSIARVLSRASATGPWRDADRLPLEDFQSMRTSIVWEFNKLYWSRVNDWEAATGLGYEAALPGGVSDGHQPEAICDSVNEFWNLLRDMESKGPLPTEINIMEIGVGTGARMGLWLNQFREMDRERGTSYYSCINVLLGDYSHATLDKTRPQVKDHLDKCQFIEMDAINPFRAVPHMRDSVLQVHTTNVYDNLPDEEITRRDGHLYFVQVRLFVPMADVERMSAAYGVPQAKFRDTVHELLSCRPDYLGDQERGMKFWMDLWESVRLEERFVRLEDLPEFPFPHGLDAAKLEDIFETTQAPADFRMHLSSGALESFVRTLPLLHPRGYLQAQDIFVTDMLQYRLGYYGPGKLDGSLLNWVNGALLREVAERAGYNVHFTPFRYRKGAKTSLLHTTRRD
jgi:hypothetical protein